MDAMVRSEAALIWQQHLADRAGFLWEQQTEVVSLPQTQQSTRHPMAKNTSFDIYMTFSVQDYCIEALSKRQLEEVTALPKTLNFKS